MEVEAPIAACCSCCWRGVGREDVPESAVRDVSTSAVETPAPRPDSIPSSASASASRAVAWDEEEEEEEAEEEDIPPLPPTAGFSLRVGTCEGTLPTGRLPIDAVEEREVLGSCGGSSSPPLPVMRVAGARRNGVAAEDEGKRRGEGDGELGGAAEPEFLTPEPENMARADEIWERRE